MNTNMNLAIATRRELLLELWQADPHVDRWAGTVADALGVDVNVARRAAARISGSGIDSAIEFLLHADVPAQRSA